eukprot:SAG11_NODE_33234_length_278_cov_0.910615_2_plen_60_part_01
MAKQARRQAEAETVTAAKISEALQERDAVSPSGSLCAECFAGTVADVRGCRRSDSIRHA